MRTMIGKEASRYTALEPSRSSSTPVAFSPAASHASRRTTATPFAVNSVPSLTGPPPLPEIIPRAIRRSRTPGQGARVIGT